MIQQKLRGTAEYQSLENEKPKAETRPSKLAVISDSRFQSAAQLMLNAQEEERRRISREIHDDLGPRISDIVFSLRRVGCGPDALPKAVGSELDQILGKILELSKVIRNLSHQLHSPVLEFAGLRAGLRSLCQELQTKTGIEVLFTSCQGLTDVSDEVALCVYRIAQEALNNIGRHSGAKKAVVELTRGPKEIQLTIRDFGKGFNPERSRKRGLGLISMSERARLLHGALEISSQIGSGTQVSLKIPFVRRKSARVGRAVGQGAG